MHVCFVDATDEEGWIDKAEGCAFHRGRKDCPGPEVPFEGCRGIFHDGVNTLLAPIRRRWALSTFVYQPPHFFLVPGSIEDEEAVAVLAVRKVTYI